MCLRNRHFLLTNLEAETFKIRVPAWSDSGEGSPPRLWTAVFLLCLHVGKGLPRWHSGKEPTCQCRRCERCRFDPCVQKIPWRRAWQPTPELLPGESHGQRSLASYSPCDLIESDTDWSDLARMHAGERTNSRIYSYKGTNPIMSSVSSVQSLLCPTLCDPLNRSTPGLPVHHQLLEFTQTHVHRVGDTIQPSHPLSSPSPPAPNPSQNQGLFQWVNSSNEVAKVLGVSASASVLPMNTQDWAPSGWTG